MQLGFLLIELGRFDEASQHLEVACRAAPNNVPALLGLSDAHFEAGRPEQAQATLRRALALEPQNQHAARLRAKFGMR